ncbi:MAG: hypothetical protein LBD76_01865, partial [Prevotellaceae bacterium]|nr:hypothetical protein [Prevotellaceae bacterium]
MANVDYIIRIGTKGEKNIETVKKKTDALNEKVLDIGNSFKRMLGIASAGAIFAAIVKGSKKATDAYYNQLEMEAKLARVMRNTQGANNSQVRSILDLTAAQQKLGVIGDEVQISGAQELGTYLEKTSSLQKLIPVMND